MRRPDVRRTAILLPNGFTLANLFFGVFAVVAASRGQFDMAGRYEDTAPRYQLAVAVMQFAELLRHSPWAGDSSLAQLRPYAESVAQALPEDADVQEFAQLVARAGQIGR